MKANPKSSISEAEIIAAFSNTFGPARAEDVRNALRAGTLTVEGLIETIAMLAPTVGAAGGSAANAVLRAAKPTPRLDRKLDELAAGVKSFLNVGAGFSDAQERHELRFSRPRTSYEDDGLSELVAAGLSLEAKGKRIHVRIGGCNASGSWSFKREEGAQVLSTIRSVWRDSYATGLIRDFLASEGATQ